jgi:hypothetical protein
MRNRRVLLALLALAIPATLFGQIRLSISVGPPALPVYEQPICPGDGYLWTPGYWAYDDSVSDYYWVAGEWVMAPEQGFLWTPGYWGWGNGGYRFNEGYWGPEVGFYGGINYGFGYSGDGYDGGRWDRGQFFYNRSDNNVDVARNHNVYDTHVKSQNVSRVSFNGGTGGIEARETSQQEAVGKQRHIAPVALQIQHAQTARVSPESRSSVNHGQPPVATYTKSEVVNDHQTITPTRAIEPSRPEGVGATTVEPRAEPIAKQSEINQPRKVVHPNDLAPIQHPAPTNSGNAKADQKYQLQQDNLIAKQNQERQSLQNKQDSEHQQMTQQRVSDSKTQQVEQKHAQQTQQQSNKHTAQQQTMQSRQPQPKQQKQQDSPDKKN